MIYVPNLNKEESDKIEGPVTTTEVFNFLKRNIKNYKSLGPINVNGNMSEFFKFFGGSFLLQEQLINQMNYCIFRTK